MVVARISSSAGSVGPGLAGGDDAHSVLEVRQGALVLAIFRLNLNLREN